jgi:O-antigen/teichoic acid export membrane protein
VRVLETASAMPSGSGQSGADAQSRLLRRGSVYTLTLALQMVSALVSVPVLTRLLKPSEFGQTATAVVVYTMLSILAAAGLPEAASRRYFSGPDGPLAARRLLLSMLGLAVAVAGVIELTSFAWAPALDLRHTDIVRIAIAGGAAGAVLLGVQALLRVQERPWAFLAIALIAAAGGQGLGVAGAAVIGTPTAYVGGLMIGITLAAGLGLTLIGGWRTRPAPPAELSGALGIGLPLVAHGVAVSMLVSVDRIVIGGVLGLAAAGRYAVAYAVGGIGVALVTAINQAWMPLLLSVREADRWPVLESTSRTIHVLAAGAAAALALLAPLGLVLAAPASYDRSKLIPVAAIVAASALPYATCGTYFQVVFLSGRTRVMALAAPISAVLNIVANLILLPAIGLVGAAVATLVAYGALPVIVSWRARRIVSLPGPRRDAALAWLATAPLVAAGAVLPDDAPGWAARGGLLALTLAGVAAATRHGLRTGAVVEGR